MTQRLPGTEGLGRQSACRSQPIQAKTLLVRSHIAMVPEKGSKGKMDPSRARGIDKTLTAPVDCTHVKVRPVVVETICRNFAAFLSRIVTVSHRLGRRLACGSDFGLIGKAAVCGARKSRNR